jgi:hypothetical protein
MIEFIFVFLLLYLLNQLLLGRLSRKYAFFNAGLMRKLYWYHLFFLLVYFIYASYNPSDSIQYYKVAKDAQDLWPMLFEPGTPFISFLGAPFVQLGFEFPTLMLLFSWMGYIGFVFAYLFFKENIPLEVTIFKRFDLLTVLLFLPNMHFWTVSFGKGSVIFMGLMLFTQAVRYPQRRMLTLILGAFFVYMVRPHVILFVLVGVMVGLLTGRGKLTLGVKILILAVSIGFLYQASSSILAVAKLEKSQNIIDDFEQFSESRSTGLSEKAGSGIAMNNYPLPFKFFTFWFRPLFVDAPNFLGIFSSLENLLYLILFLKICNWRFVKFIRQAPYMVKMSAIVFLLTSFAMTFVMSNLGIIMRQKSMVMYFGFFVIYYFLAQKKFNKQFSQKQKYSPVNS